MVNENEYIKGFNHGYDMVKYCPELTIKIVKSIQESDSEYAEGWVAGNKEYLMEQEKSQEIEMEERDYDLER